MAGGIEREPLRRTGLTRGQEELMTSAGIRRGTPSVKVPQDVSERIRNDMQNELSQLKQQRSGLVRFFQWLLHVRS